MDICRFLTTEQPVAGCDIIFVLAGISDRKAYALDLFRRMTAPRLILSVARFDVRATAEMLPRCRDDLFSLRERVPPHKRHFWIDMHGDGIKVAVADLQRSGTFEELRAFADYVSPRKPSRIGLISTAIHLRRVRYCCSRIPALAAASLFLWAVPEKQSSFQPASWWKRRSDFRYVISECAKLLAYKLLY